MSVPKDRDRRGQHSPARKISSSHWPKTEDKTLSAPFSPPQTDNLSFKQIHRLIISHSNKCPCSAYPQPPNHTLHSCPIFKALRYQTSPVQRMPTGSSWVQKRHCIRLQTSLYFYFYSILFCSRLCPSTAESIPLSEFSNFFCLLLSLSIPLPVAPQCHLSNDV